MHRKPPIPPGDTSGRYRGYAANTIHDLVMRFLHNQITVAQVQQTFQDMRDTCHARNQPDPFLETSIHGHTHLLDALNLALPISQQIHSDPRLAQEAAINKATCLFTLIFQSTRDINTQRLLLRTADEYGLTPFHATLRLGDASMFKMIRENIERCFPPEEIRALIYAEHESALRHIWTHPELYNTLPEYFRFIYDVFNKGILNRGDLAYFLSATDHLGYSLFHKVMLQRDPELVQLAADCLTIIPPPLTPNLFLCYTRESHTAMHAIAALPSDYPINTFLAVAKRQVLPFDEAPTLTPRQYTRVFTASTHAGITPAHIVFRNPHSGCAKAYVSELEWGRENDFIPFTELKRLWLAAADNKNTVLSCAIESGTVENVERCLKVVSRLHHSQHVDALTADELMAYMRQTTLSGKSLLHLAAETGNLRVIKELVKFIRLEMLSNAAELLRYLFNASPDRNLPYCPSSYPDAQHINSYLSALRTLVTVKDLQQLENALMAYENHGSMPAASPMAATAAAMPTVMTHTHLFAAASSAPLFPVTKADFSTDVPPAVAPPPLTANKPKRALDEKEQDGRPKKQGVETPQGPKPQKPSRK